MESLEPADTGVGPSKRRARWLSLSGVVLMLVASYGLPYPLGLVLGPIGFGLLIAGFLLWIYERSMRSSIRQGIVEQRQRWSGAATMAFHVEMIVAILVVVVVGVVVVFGLSFGEWEPGDGHGDWLGAAVVAYPLAALAFSVLSVRLWARRSPWAYVTPLAIVAIPLAIAWLGLNLH